MKPLHALVPALVIWCAALACGPVVATAAPVAPGESLAASAPDDRGLGSLAERAGGRDVPEANKTIDLLVEMQPRTAGLEFNDRARAMARDVNVRPTAAGRQDGTPALAESAAATVQPRSGLFGAGAVPAVHANRPSPPAVSDWKPSAGGGGAQRGVDAGGSGRSASADVDARWLWLPQEVVNFVREHRALVAAGAAVLLAVLWAGSMAVSNARR